MKRTGFALVAAIAFACPVPSQAQSLVWINQAYNRLQYEPYANSGRDMAQWFADRVVRGQAWVMTIVPQESEYFFFPGACDDDCTQLSITIYNYRGEQVARNLGTDGHTTTFAFLTAGQSYTVQFFPEDCDAEFCFTIGSALH